MVSYKQIKFTNKQTLNKSKLKKTQSLRMQNNAEEVSVFGSPLPQKPYHVALRVNSLESNKKRLLLRRRVLLKAFLDVKKRKVFFKNKFDLKNFYKLYILKLFSNYNFRLNFLKIIKESFALGGLERKIFLKFQFFGHAFFKRRILLLLKKRYTDFILQKNCLFIKKDKNKNILLLATKIANGFLYLKTWFLSFFLNKYNAQSNQGGVLFFSLTGKLNQLFLLKNIFLDSILIQYIKVSRGVKTWVNYKIRKLKKKYKIVSALAKKERQRQYYLLKESNLKNFSKSKGNGHNLLEKKHDIQYFLKQIQESFILMYISVKLNNVFITLTNNVGKILLKYSGGHFGFRGKRRRDSESILNVARIVALNIKKQANLNLIVVIKNSITNQYLNVILKAFVSRGLYPAALVYAYNRPITAQRFRKNRRI